MIIASIAMEELALSHIVNAEGEKLQYVLGTLPGGQRTCASIEEILAVNKSATELLDTVMQCQMLLKGKMEKALEAGGRKPAPKPDPSCPCEPTHPCPCPCEQAHPCEPACADDGSHSQKSAIRLVTRCNGFAWDNGFLLAWKCQGQRGCDIHWNKEMPALVDLNPKKTYALHYTINVRNSCSKDGIGSVLVRIRPCDAFSGILPLYFSTKSPEKDPITLHYSTILFPQVYPPPCADLSLLLDHKCGLFVEQASLDIIEV